MRPVKSDSPGCYKWVQRPWTRLKWPGRAPPAIGGLGRVCAAPRPPRGAHRAPQSARGTDPPRELCSARDARGAAARAAHAGAARPLGEHVPRDALAGARGRGLPGGLRSTKILISVDLASSVDWNSEERMVRAGQGAGVRRRGGTWRRARGT